MLLCVSFNYCCQQSKNERGTQRLPALSLLVSADRMFYETKDPYSAGEINDFLWKEGLGVVMETSSQEMLISSSQSKRSRFECGNKTWACL